MLARAFFLALTHTPVVLVCCIDAGSSKFANLLCRRSVWLLRMIT